MPKMPRTVTIMRVCKKHGIPVWAALLMLCGAIPCNGGETDTLAPPRMAVPLTYFGFHSHRFHDPALRPTLPFGAWRLWGAGVEWRYLEPEKNVWRFDRLRFVFSIAAARGYELLYTVGRTPAWASANPTQKSLFGPGEAAPPRDIADFARYVRKVAQISRRRIKFYEVWNEPGAGGMFSGSVAQMVEMTRIVRKEVKAVDREARIVCPSPAKHSALPWFRQFLAAGGAAPCDIIGYHFYTDNEQPEERLSLIREVFGLLRDAGAADKPVWDTESGLSIGYPALGDSPVASAPAHLARWLILTWAAGVERFYWYAWDHDKLGFQHADGTVRVKALRAYEIVQRWMLGSTFHSCERSGKLWSCQLTLSNGSAAAIMWTEDNAPITVDAQNDSTLEDIHGSRHQLGVPYVSVTGDPVLIVAGDG